MPAETLVQSRWIGVLGAVGSACILGAGLLVSGLFGPPALPWIGYPIAGAGVPFLLACLTITLRPQSLTLTGQGFTVRSALLRTRSYGWDQVDRFFLWRAQSATKAQVCFVLTPDARRRTAFRRMDHALATTVSVLGRSYRPEASGFDGALPSYLLDEQALLDLVNAYKQRASTA